MDKRLHEQLPDLLEALGLDEEPVGFLFADNAPETGFSPKPCPMPTAEAEGRGELDWGAVQASFSCAISHIWRARRKRTAAWFSAEHWGCPGAAYWMGFNKPQLEGIVRYVSEGEGYCASADTLRGLFAEIDPAPVPAPYLVAKPLGLIEENENPEFVTFFARPEVLSGLSFLVFFVTGDPEVVAAPWSAACGGLVAWPMRYRAKGLSKAVLGGFDPSARKFHRPDELSFTVPMPMFEAMIDHWETSFLARPTWKNARKKIDLSRRAWGDL